MDSDPAIPDQLLEDFNVTVETIRFDQFVPGNYYKHKASNKVFRFLGGAVEDGGKMGRYAIYQNVDNKQLRIKKVGPFMATFDPTPLHLEADGK